MTVTGVDKDYDNLTITLVAEFDAPPQRVWELWSDPRKLERWWGPPTYPATFEAYELAANAEVRYFMTGAEGDRHHGWWRIVAADPPNSLEFLDAFAGQDGEPVEGKPMNTVEVRLSENGGGTRMEMRTRFDSREYMDELIGMQMVEGMQQSISQMDALLTPDGSV
jgi:uncharacterized protein YndB with AHSA1/START domain